MTWQTKTITGVSIVTVLLFLLHAVHLANIITDFNSNNAAGAFKNAPVSIIIKDSAGNTDTMSMEKYLQQLQNNDSIKMAN